MSTQVKKKAHNSKCPFCKKANNHIPKSHPVGNYVGSGSTLGKNEMKLYWKKYPKMKTGADHPFSFHPKYNVDALNRPFKKDSNEKVAAPSSQDANDFIVPFTETKSSFRMWTSEAHHLISSVCMKYGEDETGTTGEYDQKWIDLCYTLGYDINRAENGIFLPTFPPLACKLKVPLHCGNHNKTVTNIMTTDDDNSQPVDRETEAPTNVQWKNYVKAVRDEIAPLKKNVKKNFCDKFGDKAAKQFIEDMNLKSFDIWKYVEKFDWKITDDGEDYNTGERGCCSYKELLNIVYTENITEKRTAIENGHSKCEIDDRGHDEISTYRAPERNNTRNRFDAASNYSNGKWKFTDAKDGKTHHHKSMF